mgnify:FL=1
MKTAIITGVTGQDGSYLAEFLLNKGYKVVGFKRRSSTDPLERLGAVLGNPNFELFYGNMHDGSSIWKCVAEKQPDEFYNLAAQSHVHVSFDAPEEAIANIAKGTQICLEAIKVLKPDCRYYQASSSEMFGDSYQEKQNEKTIFDPNSPYAAAKTCAHFLTRIYRQAYSLHASAGILFNHESPRRGEHFVTRKITKAAARIKLGLQDKLYLGNLDAKRDWGFAGDYIEAMWMMLQHSEPDEYVVATGKTHTVREFLEVVFQHAGLNYEDHVVIDQRFIRPRDVPYLCGDPSKAEKTLGWKPKTSMSALAKMMYESDLEYEKQGK